VTELHYQSICDVAPAIRGGSVSPVQLTELLLARIERLDEQLLCYVHVAADALDQARRAEKQIRDGRWRGPLHGIPVAIKDNYTTTGMPTRVGCPAVSLSLPEKDAACVARLRDAGAVILGKLNMHQFAWGNVTPPTTNPWDTARVPGGSSGGSGAAVAAGLCYAALGSDTGGSVRIPASACGTFGIKPTYGRVSKAGIVPHSWSLDHPGLLTRSAADAAIVLEVLAGPDPDDPATVDVPVPSYSAQMKRPFSSLRIGVCRNHFFEKIDPDVAKAVEDAIDTMARNGARVTDFTVPHLAYGLGAIFVIELASSSSYHDRALKAHLQEEFEPDVRTLVELGKFITAADYLQAERFRRVLARDFAKVFDDIDIIATPTMPITAWKLADNTITLEGQQESVLAASWRLTYPFNLIGVPASSQVCGFHPNGMPIGLQLAGKPFDEGTVLATARAYECLTRWNDQHPSLVRS
jgi:aspartyl-tRNA(Asn)/glutamyl-tRNA(Gln) amidotransferase subunit A